jgi:hypothetical protein
MFKKYALYFFPFLILLFVRFGLHFNGLYGQDAFEYLRYAGRLKEFISGGKLPGDYFWPVGYPFYGALLSFIFRDVSFSLQFISTAALVGTLIYGRKILELFYPERKGTDFYLFIFICLSPLVLRSSLICMSDAGAMFFITAFFYHAFKFREDGKGIHLVLLFLFAANAFMFRYVSLVLLVIPSLFIFRKLMQAKYIPHLLAGILVFVLFVLPHLWIRSSDPAAFLQHEWLKEWSPINYFHSSFLTLDGEHNYLLPNIVFSIAELFHPGYFIAGILFLFFLFRKEQLRSEEKIIFSSVLVYLLFISGMPLQNQRFYLLTLPVFILACFRGFSFIFEKLKNSWISILFIGGIAIQGIIFVFGFRLVYARNQLERSIKEWIVTNTTQKTIYSFDMDVSLKSGGLDRHFYNLWEKKYDSFEPNSLVLFNPTAFEKQWAGKNPMINWENLKKEKQMVLLESFPEGWELYEIR